MTVSKIRIKKNLITFYKSIWFFPVLLLIPVIFLTSLKVSGSSIGVYHTMFYGPSKDDDLLLNRPRGIRSDEWIVNTQQVIAQSKANFPAINKNIGEGQNMTTSDAPYREWSIVFKPLNFAYFILPLEFAFALKWWLMGYLLIISCYFFVLKLIPNKRLMATLISSSLYFAAFVQWWYVNGTIASLFYPLFIALTLMNLYKTKTFRSKLLFGLLLFYLITCFALVLYPPFQIATGLVLGAFVLGHILENFSKWNKAELKQNLFITILSGILSIFVLFVFVFTRLDVIKTTTNTVYPGKRTIQSGGFPLRHFLSPHLGYQFTSENKTGRYLFDGKNPSNQSEDSNFLLILPFLFLPSIYLIVLNKKNKLPPDWKLILINALFVVFLLQMFVPSFTPIAEILMLNKVGTSRLLIGFGLLNTMALVLFIRNYSKGKYIFSQKTAIIYSGLVLLLQLYLAFYAHNNFVSFISVRGAIIFSIPLPLVVYFLIRKKFLIASCIYLLFSVFITIRVNPLYKGLGVLTESKVSKYIQTEGKSNDLGWASDGGYLENIASLNGERSISGVYNYPQLALWEKIPGSQNATYNRYAHVGVQLLDNPSAKTNLDLVAPDNFVLKANACSPSFNKLGVKYVVSASLIKGECVHILQKITWPNIVLYVYKLN